MHHKFDVTLVKVDTSTVHTTPASCVVMVYELADKMLFFENDLPQWVQPITYVLTTATLREGVASLGGELGVGGRSVPAVRAG